MRIPQMLLTTIFIFNIFQSLHAQQWQYSNGNATYVDGNVGASLAGSGTFVQLWSDNALIWKSGSQWGGLRFGSATNMSAGGYVDRMRLTDNGYLGIGTNYPRERLDVWGGSISVTGNDLNGTLTAGSQAGIAYMGCNALTNGISINSNGYVGIGTNDTKGYKFAVNGNAVFNKVVVKQYPWADYVFHSNYRLRPLSELEEYIKQYHHLPEVPSAEDVEKNGLDVGDNQAMLLKKIEELTLYVIEQNKNQQAHSQQLQELNQRVGALQQENAQLKKRINGGKGK